MPLNKDQQGGGTNTDGSISKMYCSKCYANGHFINPDITAEEMKIRVKQKLREMGFPGFVASLFAIRIPKLERWKSKS